LKFYSFTIKADDSGLAV